jgi:hypothetical protein
MDGHHKLAAVGPDSATVLPFHGLVLVAAVAAAILGQGACDATGQRLVGMLLVVAAVADLRAHRWTRQDASLLSCPPASQLPAGRY